MPHMTPACPCRAALSLLILMLFPFAVPEASAVPGKEYQVKAVFLYNFAQFVQWPASALPDDSSALVVGILGDDPFDSYLDEVVRGERINGHPVKVVRYARKEDVRNCHVLFVSASESQGLAPLLSNLKSRKILTVGESDLFARQGGMVSFVTKQGKVRFKINLDAVQDADLTLSSKLLRLAEIVPPVKG